MTRNEIEKLLNARSRASVAHSDYFAVTGGGKATLDQLTSQGNFLKAADTASRIYETALARLKADDPKTHQRLIDDLQAFWSRHDMPHRRLFPTGEKIGRDD